MDNLKTKDHISLHKLTWQSYIRNAFIPLIIVQVISICVYFISIVLCWTTISDMDWKLIVATPKEDIYSTVNALNHTLIKLGFVSIIIQSILTCLLFLSFITKSAKKTSYLISNSFLKIKELMDQIGNGYYSPKAPEFDIEELNDLSINLTRMGQHLGETNKNLLLTQYELRKKETDLKALVNSINDIIMEVNSAGDITNFWSMSHYDLYKKYMHNKLTSISFILDNETTKIAKEKISHVLQTKHTLNMDFCIESNSNIKWFEASISPRLNSENRVVVSARDITEQKKLSESIIIAKEEAEKASKAKSEFLSSMSHELRTPLNAILGFSQVLELDPESPLTNSQNQSVREIIKAGNHLLELINEVLDLAKIESGKLSISMETVSIKSILEETLALIRPFADKDGIKINFSQIDNSEEFVYADHMRLKQILLNLLTNAIKYNKPNGEVTFYHDKIDTNFRFHVIDTGIGLSESEINLIFKPFHRLNTINNSIEGTGIGLTVAKQLVELMNGEIHVTSEKGIGSHFWVEFSLIEASSIEIPKNTLSIESKKTNFNNKNYTVLYAEDNPANLRLVKRILCQINNLKMVSATSGELCIDLAISHKPDLILLDINLPGIDGYEVFKLLRLHEETKNIPVVAISAHAMPKDIQTGLSLGFSDYITKPINISIFLEKISKILNKTKT